MILAPHHLRRVAPTAILAILAALLPACARQTPFVVENATDQPVFVMARVGRGRGKLEVARVYEVLRGYRVVIAPRHVWDSRKAKNHEINMNVADLLGRAWGRPGDFCVRTLDPATGQERWYDFHASFSAPPSPRWIDRWRIDAQPDGSIAVSAFADPNQPISVTRVPEERR